jgi:predicted patatin/cPLA2 family phospholipase
LKTGIIDIGGGLKGVYSAGIYDNLIDRGIKFDYYLGVSAGAANLSSYMAGQRGRNSNFYLDYAWRKPYMGFNNWIMEGNFFNLDYVYGTLSVVGGEDPLDVEAMKKTGKEFYAVSTDAMTGKPHYFNIDEIEPDNLKVFNASSAIPVACRPQRVHERFYFDGGCSDPIPWQKALNDGVDLLVVIMNRPVDSVKSRQRHLRWLEEKLRDYPNVFHDLVVRHKLYNKELAELIELEKKGMALRVGPDDLCGVSTMKRDKMAFARLYDKGYDDGARINNFLKQKGVL